MQECAEFMTLLDYTFSSSAKVIGTVGAARAQTYVTFSFNHRVLMDRTRSVRFTRSQGEKNSNRYRKTSHK